MRQAEANAAPAARAAAKVLVRKAAAPAPGWTRCPGHPEDITHWPPELSGLRNQPCLRSAATSPCPSVPAVSPGPAPLAEPGDSLHLPQPGAAPRSDAARTAPMLAASPAPSDALKHRHLLLLAEEGVKPPFSTQKVQSREEKGGSGSTHRCPHQAISRHPVGSEPE